MYVCIYYNMYIYIYPQDAWFAVGVYACFLCLGGVWWGGGVEGGGLGGFGWGGGVITSCRALLFWLQI